MPKQFKIKVDDTQYEIEINGNSLLIDGVPFVVGASGHMITLDGIAYDVSLDGNTATVDQKKYKFETLGFKSKSGEKKEKVKPRVKAGKGSVLSVMPGAILRIDVKEGDKVEPGKVLMILEAMKMENEVQAEQGGIVKKVHVSVGDKVEERQPLVDIVAE